MQSIWDEFGVGAKYITPWLLPPSLCHLSVIALISSFWRCPSDLISSACCNNWHWRTHSVTNIHHPRSLQQNTSSHQINYDQFVSASVKAGAKEWVFVNIGIFWCSFIPCRLIWSESDLLTPGCRGECSTSSGSSPPCFIGPCWPPAQWAQGLWWPAPGSS